ncbi:MAG: type III-B CRISPR module RAMP protein Cmr6 [Thermoguttaceae bacterium]
MARSDERGPERLSPPIYRGAVEPLRGLELFRGNGGLWFDKFCDTWEAPSLHKPPSPLPPSRGEAASSNESKWYGCKVDKKSWLDKFVDMVGDEQRLAAFAERRSLFLNALGGKPIELVTESRFVTGLGRQHPIENGFAWHHALGVPYLPGSSVKGLVRAWAESKLVGQPDPAVIGRIFGRLENDQGNAGSVIFFDALPARPVRLEKDVMTPHYGPYYQEGETPGDWHSPTPIPFLVVAAGQRFTLAVAPSSRGRSDQCKEDCDTALEWLQASLEWLGAGAKTAVGYGRFTKIEEIASSSITTAEHRLQNPRQKLDVGKVPARPATASPSPTTGAVRVQVIGLHEKLGKSCFFVKEEGKARGVLKYGKPPEKLPEIEDWIEVHRTNDNPRSPEYRWDKPEPPRDQARGRRPPTKGGRR